MLVWDGPENLGRQDKTSGDRADFSGRVFNKTRTTNIIPGGDIRL